MKNYLQRAGSVNLIRRRSHPNWMCQCMEMFNENGRLGERGSIIEKWLLPFPAALAARQRIIIQAMQDACWLLLVPLSVHFRFPL